MLLVQALTTTLEQHEQYAKSLQANDKTFDLLRDQYAANVESLNAEITELEKQKGDLQTKITELEKGSEI